MKVMYYIAVLPKEAIRREIKTMKLEVRDHFGAAHALRSPAHITLQMPFHFEEAHELRLVEAIGQLALKHRAFICDLKGFGHFGNRTIFIEVIPNDALNALRKNVQKILEERFAFGPKKLTSRFHPHITIANRDLTEENFKKCWVSFRERPYERTIEISAITLLKHRGDHWEAYHNAPFGDA